MNRHERRATTKKILGNKLSADFRVTAWLSSPSAYTMPLGGEGGVVPKEAGWSNLNVLAWLIAKNGFRPRVTGWGRFEGPFGLTQPDAFLLMELGPYFQGLIDGGGLYGIATAEKYLEPELMRLADEFEKHAPAEDVAPAALENTGGDESVAA